MKTAFFGVDGESLKILKESFPDETLFITERLVPENANMAKDAEILCVFVNSTVDKGVIDSFPNLKLIVTRSTGYDHIDCKYAESKGIKVANVPGYGAYTVAEFAFGLILNLSRRIIWANQSVREGRNLNQTEMMQGFDLRGKTLGIVGTGKIGKNVARIARGFSMNILAFDPHPDLAFANENAVSYKTLEEVLSGADIVTLHCPLTAETRHILGHEQIKLMKKGCYLINTARGELVDTEALLWGLESGIIEGAGLDVLEKEREQKAGAQDRVIELNKKLMGMDSVIITPHIAFDSREAVAEILKTTIDNIKNFLAGSPTNIVK